MAAVTAPRARRSLVGVVLAFVQVRLATRGKSGRVAKAAAVARQHVVTVAALAAFDVGMFHWGPGAGWIGVCVSLLALDFAVTG